MGSRQGTGVYSVSLQNYQTLRNFYRKVEDEIPISFFDLFDFGDLAVIFLQNLVFFDVFLGSKK
jgi:hypothetical protein